MTAGQTCALSKKFVDAESCIRVILKSSPDLSGRVWLPGLYLNRYGKRTYNIMEVRLQVCLFKAGMIETPVSGSVPWNLIYAHYSKAMGESNYMADHTRRLLWAGETLATCGNPGA